MVGGRWQLKVEPPGEVTIEHTEHVGGLFSSVWGRGGPGIQGGIIWSFQASKVLVELQESWGFKIEYVELEGFFGCSAFI